MAGTSGREDLPESDGSTGGSDGAAGVGGPEPGDGDGEEAEALRRWGIRLLQLLLTGVVTWFIVDRVGVTAADVADLRARWLDPRWGLLAGASSLLLAGFVLSALLWGRMVRELGGPALDRWEAASIYFTSNLGRYVPGKVWQLAGVAYLARKAGVSAPLATGSAVLVQATSLAGATVVGAWALVGRSATAGGWGVWAAAAVLIIVAVTTAPPVFRRVVGLWFRVAGRRSPPELDVGPGFGLRWVALFCANWLVYTGAFWLMAASFGLQGSYVELGPAFAAAYVLGYVLIFAPAGIGVREGFLIALLEPVIGAGPGTALAVLARFWMTALELLPAAAFAGIRAAGWGRGEGGA